VRLRDTRLAAAAAVALAVALLCVGAWYLLQRNESGLPSGAGVQVVIPPKTGSAAIARMLAEQGVVPNALGFRIWARLAGDDSNLKAGTYDLVSGMSYDEVVSKLTKGPEFVFSVVAVPEGWTVDQIATRVEARTGVSAREFVSIAKTAGQDEWLLAKYPFLKYNKTTSLEGYLFPKTYQVRAGASALDIVEMMVAQYGKETASLDMSVPTSRGLDSHQVVTIASMIEREARVPSEQSLIASVIYNRLSKGMLLEIDATVLYVVGNKTNLLYRDLRVDSPYNTYMVAGLPPGPIASPGLASLQAVCAPADTGYFFYVRTGKDGSHTFTQTKVEFLAAKAQAKKGLK
jgi:UPF0755 protein